MTNIKQNDEFEQSINGRPATNEETSYRNGYVEGRNADNLAQNENRHLREENQRLRENSSATSGLFIGIIISALAILGATAFFLLNPDNQPTQTTETEREPEKETTVIERTVEKTQELVPIPQSPPENSSETVVEPKLEINVPEVEVPEVKIPGSQSQAPQESSAEQKTENGEEGADKTESAAVEKQTDDSQKEEPTQNQETSE